MPYLRETVPPTHVPRLPTYPRQRKRFSSDLEGPLAAGRLPAHAVPLGRLRGRAKLVRGPRLGSAAVSRGRPRHDRSRRRGVPSVAVSRGRPRHDPSRQRHARRIAFAKPTHPPPERARPSRLPRRAAVSSSPSARPGVRWRPLGALLSWQPADATGRQWTPADAPGKLWAAPGSERRAFCAHTTSLRSVAAGD